MNKISLIYKNIYCLLLLLLFPMATIIGCKGGFMPGVRTVPVVKIPFINEYIPVFLPDIDLPIRSINYYKEHHSNNLLSINHNTDHPFKNSKKVGKNDYLIICSKIWSIEKQLEEDYCWAACIQYLILAKHNVKIDQNEIAIEIKKRKSADMSASLLDIMRGFNFTTLKLTKNGTLHVMETLEKNQPVMLGLKGNSNEVGHVIIIVGARYSYVPGIHIIYSPETDIVFNEFGILDPGRDSKPITIPAKDIENNISFILSFSDTKYRK